MHLKNMKIKAYSYFRSQEMYVKTAWAQPAASAQPTTGGSLQHRGSKVVFDRQPPRPPSPSAGEGGQGNRASGVGAPHLELCSLLLEPLWLDPREGDPGRQPPTAPPPCITGQCPPPGLPSRRLHPRPRAPAPRGRAGATLRLLHFQHAARGLTRIHQNRPAAPHPEALETRLDRTGGRPPHNVRLTTWCRQPCPPTRKSHYKVLPGDAPQYMVRSLTLFSDLQSAKLQNTSGRESSEGL